MFVEMGEMDSFLTSLDEFVDDEDRIVTYKWLSQQLAVPANKSKEILRLYAESCKKQGNGIHIVYVIIGRSATGMCVKVARGDEIEAAKSQLDDVISTSLYSIQKVKLLDSATLYSADYNGDSVESSKLGGIVYNGAVKLAKHEIKKQTAGGSKEDISGLEKQFAKRSSDKGKAAQQKMKFFGKAKTSPTKKNLSENTIQKEKPQVVETKKSATTVSSKPQKKGGVGAFLTNSKVDLFAKSQTRPKIVKKELENVEKDCEVSSVSPKKLSPSEEEEEKKGDEIPEKTQDNVETVNLSSKRRFEEELKIDDFSDQESDDFAEVKCKKSTKNAKNVTSKSRRKGKSGSGNLPAKKRRRIRELSSSSSEEEEEEEEMDVIPPSPPSVMPPEEVKPSNDDGTHKRMKKVMKTKTFIDEDGFMVTEKVWESQECNEPDTVANDDTNKAEHDEAKTSQVEPPSKKKDFPNTSAAAQPKKPTKQASIIGFFRKK